jgi:opacity protein-like surface antigen
LLPVLALVGSLIPGGASRAEEKVELTPFIGYRVGGDLPNLEGSVHGNIAEGPSYGFLLDFLVEEGGYIEVLYSLQKTELDVTGAGFGPGQVKLTNIDVEHYFVGGTYQWETDTPALPFVSAHLGGVRFDVPGFNGETQFGWSLGGGVKLPLAKHVGLRFDGRWVSTFLNGSTALYCNSAGFCAIAAEGTYFGQFEVTGGVTIRF